MATVNVDCDIIVNGVGYLIKPGTYKRIKQRHYTKKVTQGSIILGLGGLEFIDAGPLFDEVKCVVQLRPSYTLRGTNYTVDTVAARNALYTLYNTKNTTFSVTVTTQETFTMRFMNYEEDVPEESNLVMSGGLPYPDKYDITLQFIKA